MLKFRCMSGDTCKLNFNYVGVVGCCCRRAAMKQRQEHNNKKCLHVFPLRATVWLCALYNSCGAVQQKPCTTVLLQLCIVTFDECFCWCKAVMVSPAIGELNSQTLQTAQQRDFFNSTLSVFYRLKMAWVSLKGAGKEWKQMDASVWCTVHKHQQELAEQTWSMSTRPETACNCIHVGMSAVPNLDSV